MERTTGSRMKRMKEDLRIKKGTTRRLIHSRDSFSFQPTVYVAACPPAPLSLDLDTASHSNSLEFLTPCNQHRYETHSSPTYRHTVRHSYSSSGGSIRELRHDQFPGWKRPTRRSREGEAR